MPPPRKSLPACVRSSTSVAESGPARVIHVLHLLTSLGRGGAERALADIVAASDRSRFRHTLCHLHGPHDLAGEFHAAGCETICLDIEGSRAWIGGAKKLRPILADLKPDIVQSATFEANIAARLGVGRSGPPLATWIVSMEYDPESVRAAGWPRGRNLIRRGLDAATGRYTRSHYIACSASVTRSATERLHIPRERIQTIYNLVNLATLRGEAGEAEALRAALGLPDAAFVYLTIGRVDAAKDQRTLLRAFARVAADQPDAHLLLLGKGGLADALEAEACGLGIDNRVRFVSSAPRVAPFFELADVFVFPSLLEGLPVALLEAMCAGLPCIASDIAPHLEVVRQEETGLLFRRGSAEALAAAMDRLYREPALRARLGAAARAEAEALVSADHVILQWQATWERLAGRSEAPQP